VVDKHKSVVELWATAFFLSTVLPHVPKGLGWSEGIVHKSTGLPHCKLEKCSTLLGTSL
jgi:hypothetical protein